MKRLHKILVVLLAVSMLLGVIVVSAYASNGPAAKIGDAEYATLSEAFAAANGQTAPEAVTITLAKDVKLSSGEVLAASLAGLELTFDLNGYTLDVSDVGASKNPATNKDREVYAAFYADEGASLTVKNGTVVNYATKNGIFAIEKNVNASVAIDGIVVNANGTLAFPIVNARGGKVTVTDSELVSYGVNSSVIRQANNAEVVVSDSQLFNIDGSGRNSTVIKTESTPTEILYTEIAVDNGSAASEEGEGDGEEAPATVIVERPHIYITNSELFAAANVIVTQTGCIGVCQFEPVVEIQAPGQEKVPYVKMTPDKVAEIVDEHLINGRVVTKYTIGAIAK